MAFCHCTKSIDGTIPVQALLYEDEELIASQEGVGIYDGQQKAPDYQSGVVHISTHRLFYIDGSKELENSFTIELSLINQTDYYAGLFKSSPKVTLHVRTTSITSTSTTSPSNGGGDSWECEVCGFKNGAGLSPNAANVCSLCGVPRSSLTSPRSASPAPPSDGSIACPACTFINHPSLSSCEICSTPLPSIDDSQILKLSFRNGGDKPFYAALKRCLKGKTWQAGEQGRKPPPNGDPAHETSRDAISKTGISGILQNVQTSARDEQDHLNDALQDLEALMAKAKDMVRLAAELNEKLTSVSASAAAKPNFSSPSSSSLALDLAAPSTTEPEEATFIRASLSQLGLHMPNAPVTQDMIKDERKWMEELAKELAGVLQGIPGTATPGLMKERGIVALDEVWGGWNRARGVALIPPSTFLQIIPLLPIYTRPGIHARTLASGLTVLHTPPYTPAAFASRLAGFLSLNGPQTTIDIAMEEGLSVSLIKEMVEAVERDGDIVRDDANAAILGGGGVGDSQLRWWVNVFERYVWDGQECLAGLLH